jgi:hypothetical protein
MKNTTLLALLLLATATFNGCTKDTTADIRDALCRNQCWYSLWS